MSVNSMKVDIVVYHNGQRMLLGKAEVYADSWSVQGDWFDLDRAILDNTLEFVLHKKPEE
jgi:hypothetical protein